MLNLLEDLFEHAECLTNAYAEEEARRNVRLKFPAGARQLEALVNQCERVTRMAADMTVEWMEMGALSFC